MVVCFLCTGTVPPGLAQELLLPPADQAVLLSAASMPLVLRGMKVDAKDPLHMDFLVDRGRSALSDEAFHGESLRLIKYFLAALTIPEKDLWVNLSPYENDRIIQDDLGRTGMGRDLLAQDYILKQLTAGLLHPEGETGKVFWAEVYRRAYDHFGTTDIPVDTFNKVWIVPAKSVVYESRSPDGEKISAFVQEMKLKVMLETDYLATSNNPLPTGGHVAPQGYVSPSTLPSELALDAKASEGTNLTTSELAKDILREVVIPVLEKEVNEGANFSLLRQVSYSLILSVWLKKKLMASAQEAAQGDPRTGSLFSRIFVNRHKTGGIEIADPKAQTRLIYDRYVEAFKRGAYDLIREEVDTYSQELIPRKYFSGGFSADKAEENMEIINGAPMVQEGDFLQVAAQLNPADMAEMNGPHEGRAVNYQWRYQKDPVTGKMVEVREEITYADGSRVVNRRPGHPRFSRSWIAGLIISATIAGGIYFHSQGGAEASRDTLTPQELFRDVETATSNFEVFEEALFNNDQKRISSLKFLSGVLNENVPSDLDEKQKMEKEKELSKKLAGLINSNYDAFCPEIREAGISVDDYGRLLLGITLRESRGNMGAQQGKVVKTKAQARGGTQVEYTTYLTMLEVAYKKLKAIPDRTPAQERAFQRVRKERARTHLGSKKENVWLSLSPKDEVVDPEFHFMIVAIWINHMFTAEPVLMEKLAFAADAPKFRKQGVTIESSLKERLEAPTPTMKDSYEKLLKEFPRIPREEVFAVLVASAWNGGINRSEEDRRHILELYQSSEKQRKKFTAKAGSSMSTALLEKKPIYTEIVLHGQGKRSNLSKEDLGSLYSQFHAINEMFRKEQRSYNLLDPVVYAEIVVNMTKEGTGPLVQSAKDFRGYRDFLKNSDKKDKAELMKGGIDLGEQDDVMTVFGTSGNFALDLSPEQLKMLDQDVQGFLPIIINVQPVKDVKMFLGFQAADEVPVGS